MPATEINFDGIVGPTHNYAGLSFGNVASMQNRRRVSNPRAAALEGLAKMKFLAGLGIKQAVLPPHERPHVATLRRLGFGGSDAQVIETAYQQDAMLLAGACSASSMWAANAATVSPSADTADARVHFTPANLVANLHRAIEPPLTTRILRTIFADPKYFHVHDPLPPSLQLGDEGAANHMRLCAEHGEVGVEVFVYGRLALDPTDPRPANFPARQAFEASVSIARNHLLRPERVVFLRQNPQAIDHGVFHNDVAAVANQNVLLYHEGAYADADAWEKMAAACPQDQVLFVRGQMPIADAVSSYLFNSQLVTLPDHSMALIAPAEARQFPSVQQYIDSLTSSGTPIRAAHYVDVRQSMQNGGGPACLRLRVVLTDEQAAAMQGKVMLTDSLHDQLKSWIERHYRERLAGDDLRDPLLLEESRAALDELTQILELGPIYEFQQ